MGLKDSQLVILWIFRKHCRSPPPTPEPSHQAHTTPPISTSALWAWPLASLTVMLRMSSVGLGRAEKQGKMSTLSTVKGLSKLWCPEEMPLPSQRHGLICVYFHFERGRTINTDHQCDFCEAANLQSRASLSPSAQVLVPGPMAILEKTALGCC